MYACLISMAMKQYEAADTKKEYDIAVITVSTNTKKELRRQQQDWDNVPSFREVCHRQYHRYCYATFVDMLEVAEENYSSGTSKQSDK